MMCTTRFAHLYSLAQVYLNGERTHTHESYAGFTFNTLGVEASGVSSVMFESVGLLPDECISLIEVGDVVVLFLAFLPPPFSGVRDRFVSGRPAPSWNSRRSGQGHKD